VTLDTTKGPIILEVADGFTVRANVQVIGSAGVTVRVSGQQPVMLERSFAADIIAPQAQVTLGSNAPQTFKGRFIGREVFVRPRSTVVCAL
jgi:hypothetical protein